MSITDTNLAPEEKARLFDLWQVADKMLDPVPSTPGTSRPANISYRTGGQAFCTCRTVLS